MGLHAFLQPAKEAATEEVKGAAFIDETGAVVEPPTTAELLMLFTTYQQQTTTLVAELQQTAASQLATIGLLTEALATKASASSLADVRQRVTTLATTVDAKADEATVQQRFAANYELDATQSDAIRAAQQLLATDGGMLQSLLASQSSQATLLSALRTDVDAKAAASTVSSLTGQVTTLRNTVNDATTGLATRAAGADLAALTTTVAGKALASDLATTNNNVAANTSAIALRATAAALATQVGRIDGIMNTTVPALQADTALRLLRAGDTATGLIKGPDATAKTAYPTFQQTFGGVNSPRRTIQNITTGTTAMVALTDTTGQNRTILPIGIQFLLTGSLGLLSSVTVKLGTTNGGAEIYTKTYSVLTGLVGKVTTIDQPTTATPLPAGQILYATVVGGGVWTVFFDAVFLPTAS